MLRMRLAGLRRLVNRLQPHLPHQPANPMPADLVPVPVQLAHDLPAAKERTGQVDFVDPPHQRQRLLIGRARAMVQRRPTDRHQMALPAQTQFRVARLGHGFANIPAHRLSPRTQKSRSTVNSPIFACRSRTAAS